jgi:hypothetical protein
MTTLTELLETPPRNHHEVEVSSGAVQATLDYLGSPGALASVARDPYWPKWDSPWWHMALLHEIGLSPLIPAVLAQAMAAALQGHYLPTFPRVESEIPAGIDPYRQILCHCALGSMVQVLAGRGRTIDEALPGARAWFLRYQLPDGGLNCDEAAYTRPSPHSSMVSTLPPLEAMLGSTERPFTPEETAFLDAGANYLLQRRLCRSLSKGALIDESWLTPTFPRFYEYDVLRGLRFLVGWARRLSRPLPWSAIEEVVRHLHEGFTRDTIEPRAWARQQLTLPAVGRAPLTPASLFPLLEEALRPEVARTYLQREWHAVLLDLRHLHTSQTPTV